MDPWSVLGIRAGAPAGEAKAAYRRLALRCHPDRGGSEAEFRRVTEAYEAIRDGRAAPPPPPYSRDMGGYRQGPGASTWSTAPGGMRWTEVITGTGSEEVDSMFAQAYENAFGDTSTMEEAMRENIFGPQEGLERTLAESLNRLIGKGDLKVAYMVLRGAAAQGLRFPQAVKWPNHWEAYDQWLKGRK